MKRNKLFLTTAICSAVVLVSAPFAQAAITTTTTTTNSYDYPDSSPTVSSSSSRVEDCPVQYSDSGGGSSDGGSRSTGGGWVDTNGDGKGDTHSSKAGPGNYNSSETKGGFASGNTSVSKSGNVSGSHDNGYEGKSSGASSSSSSSGSGGGGGSSSRVICTYFYQKGEINDIAYYADIDFTRKYLSDTMVRGYHVWGIWYVEQMRKNPGGLLERIMRPIALHRANEIAYQMGVGAAPDAFGKLCRAILEPFCFALGLFAREQDWKRLYAPDSFKDFADGYRRYESYKTAQTMRRIDPRPTHVLDARFYRESWI